MISEEYRKRLAIQQMLSSKYIGFFRLCGKELQAKYRKANMAHENPDRDALIKEIIETYDYCLDNKQPPMSPKEKEHKKKLIRQCARKDWGKYYNDKNILHNMGK